ncbi:3-hydroxyacyl-CoA dehydrogenase family protein [Peredibacter starrii]|uniref:3-hydroxyacyl-CoA dehydrogenase family protein n=1 Tax=Peredibacter starrii TaxID=28202 RepID=A0AAX4HTP4_9BACT|nr:3-hydroxyacyl-CoA dehydrogenase family protein [Peredibacter starrii]WPU66294.1 3-hydroxyacyl-CoA dehydrogenase family protein [Peredibacter starrii]
MGFINMTNVSFDNILINFGFGTKEEKINVLKANPEKHVYMDLTCYDPQEFYDEYPQLKGSFAALFADDAKKMEIHFLHKEPGVIEKFKELGFTPVETTIVSCGFVFPRTIVQIINEAHFALADGVATKEDIDRAMKFGVNYPKGPFEWAEGRELYVKTLLDELFKKTGDKRYIHRF